ncbi:adenosylmethionine--8-amino-7-oxononanoate transaminase [Methylophilaceae bacterium]|jgi:adenosylmethionine---8-amino-7-oxononanoate aminotransferase|nr:adenosylmethionine--8-amino-7-oxononanoate transaminase [Methylophilaceae bacterium]
MKNKKYIKESMQYIWHPCSQMKHHEKTPLIPIREGRGSWLIDFNNKKYLDVTSSWWVNLFGHNNKIIKQHITKQLNKIEHVMLAGVTHEAAIDLSKKLSKLTKLSHCSYGSDGANAVEIALKMSSHYWKRIGLPKKNKFVYLENSYHGETIGALSVTDIPIFRKQYASLIKPYFSVPSPDLRLKKANQTSEEFIQEKIKSLKILFENKHEVISSIILEPLVQCATGMGIYDSIYLKKVRELCDKYEVHLIVDEIAVGFGRTGKMFAHQYEKIIPDFICLSKGLTGGYLPLSVTLTTDKVYSAFYSDKMADAFLHSHSYTGNPLACSAALGTLSIFEKEDVLKNNKIKSNLINKLMIDYKNLPIRNLRNIGMIWAFEVEKKIDIDKFTEYSISNGVLIRPINNTVYFMPPYCISEKEAHQMVKITSEAIKQAI